MIKRRRRKKKQVRVSQRVVLVVIITAIVLAVGGTLFVHRVRIAETFRRTTAPSLPTEEAYIGFAEDGSVPRSQDATTTPDVAPSDGLPAEKRLAVPFMSQAPHANWELPYQETCEEASALMVAGYYRGERGAYEPDEADALILQVVAYEEQAFGFYEDTSASETKRFMESLFPDLSVEIVDLKDAEQIKRYVAEGYPVMVPADGKVLPNPNFRNGGPLYHMLVIRGYTETQFITNDPGTRLGENFLYDYDGLLNAVHDWNAGDVPNGRKVILVVRPRP